jgi:hypothetical protein
MHLSVFSAGPSSVVTAVIVEPFRNRSMPVRFLIGCGLLAGVLASSDHGAAAEPVSYPNHANLLIVRDEQGQERPVKTPADWAVRRQHLLDNMQLVMGPLPGKTAACRWMQILSKKTEKYLRKNVLRPGAGRPRHGWLLFRIRSLTAKSPRQARRCFACIRRRRSEKMSRPAWAD